VCNLPTRPSGSTSLLQPRQPQSAGYSGYHKSQYFVSKPRVISYFVFSRGVFGLPKNIPGTSKSCQGWWSVGNCVHGSAQIFSFLRTLVGKGGVHA